MLAQQTAKALSPLAVIWLAWALGLGRILRSPARVQAEEGHVPSTMRSGVKTKVN